MGLGDLIDMKEINPIRNDPNKPLFFIGETNGHDKAEFNISATFDGIDSPIEKEFEFLFSHDSTKYEVLIPSLLANERLNEMLNAINYDTLGIVDLAIKYNLLTDFTALIALEPNDSLFFMEDFDDESDHTVSVEQIQDDSDSLHIEIYPNPFNNQVNIKLFVNEISNVSISIYNILGQKVTDIINDEVIDNVFSFIWNGKNAFGSTISSGFYILRAEITGISSNKKEIISKKLLYLK